MRNIIVTGSSRGIGKAIVLSIAEPRDNIVITYKSNKQKALAVAKKAREKNSNVLCLKLDQSSRLEIKKVIRKVHNKFGKIDILINNAAFAQQKPFDKINDRDWDGMMAVNLRGPFALCQEVIPDMIKKGWGRIVNIGSIGGQWGGFQQVHYAAAKAGLINLTKSLAKIYSKYGITVNAVSPGLVLTDMTKRLLGKKINKKNWPDVPIGRIATPEEIANVVVFLCSNKASYITGQTINVNGGMFLD